MQSGSYYGHLGAMKEIIQGLKKEVFDREQVKIIGTGGFNNLFQGNGVFDEYIPDLILYGLREAMHKNLIGDK